MTDDSTPITYVFDLDGMAHAVDNRAARVFVEQGRVQERKRFQRMLRIAEHDMRTRARMSDVPLAHRFCADELRRLRKQLGG